MAKNTENTDNNATDDNQPVRVDAMTGERVDLPSADMVADAQMSRDGNDLVLRSPGGETVIVEGYFSAEPAPLLVSPDGSVLTPGLVNSFVTSAPEYAANESASDESPVGAVEELKGNATVTRADGTVEPVSVGTPIYQGDIIETDAHGAVNITFMDQTSMAVSENARLAIDQYTYDPATESGTTNFSVLRGLFVFTSGMIGRDDPDDVKIDTPVGSIGIRGTIIAGEINPGGESKITVLEGAIVVSNGLGETTLSEQFETVSLSGFDRQMTPMGVVPAAEISGRFSAIGVVLPTLFSTIGDAGAEQGQQGQGNGPQQQMQNQGPQNGPVEEGPAQDPVKTQEPAPMPADQTTLKSAEPQPVLAETQPAPEPIIVPNVDIALNTTSTGLPTIQTATGQTAPLLGTSANNSFTTTAPVAGSGPLPPANTLPGTTVNTGPVPTGTMPPPNSFTPPPLPVNQPTIQFTNNNTTDRIASTGGVIGVLGTSVAGYAITISNPNYIYDSSTGELRLSSTAALQQRDNFDTMQFGPVVVTATNSTDGTSFSRTINPFLTDSNAGRTIDLNVSGGTAANGISIIGDDLDHSVGSSISALGDINNDGFDDFIFGKPVTDMVFRVNGQSAPLPSDLIPNPSMSTIVAPLSLPSVSGDNSGKSVAGIGDFNGDGTEDFVVGFPFADSSVGGSGNIRIVNGANPSQGLQFTTGPVSTSQLGSAVQGIGDFNNDGYADVLTNAPGEEKIVLIRGGFTSWTGITGVSSETITGHQGLEITAAGDMNGDGFNDFVAGRSALNSNQGGFSVFWGNSDGTLTTRTDINSAVPGQQLGKEVQGIGDVNGDGFSDVMIGGDGTYGAIYLGGSSFAGTPASVLNIPNTYTIAGGGGIGDFNGDGFDDFALSFADANETKTYVVFGKGTLDATMDVNFFKNPANAMEIRYDLANAGNDMEISRLGDINGDGFDDFAMGVRDSNGANANTDDGGVVVVYGRHNPAGAGSGAVGGLVDNTFNATAGQITGSMRGGAGADVFLLDNINYFNAQGAGIDGGGNNAIQSDAIRVMNSLDFSSVNFEKISGIEQLQFGASNQQIILTIENLFNLLKTSDTGVLKINAGSFTGSSLSFRDTTGGDGYTLGGEVDQVVDFINANNGVNATPGHSTSLISSVNYDVFTIGGYKLLVDTNVTMDAQ